MAFSQNQAHRAATIGGCPRGSEVGQEFFVHRGPRRGRFRLGCGAFVAASACDQGHHQTSGVLRSFAQQGISVFCAMPKMTLETIQGMATVLRVSSESQAKPAASIRS